MINEIIVKYLSNNKRLVIPNFGAFLKKEDNSITFVELLKRDDEVLSSLISNSMDVSTNDAMTIINNFVKSVKEQIHRNNEYVIGSIGSLVLGANGVYSLRPSTPKESNLTTDTQHKEVTPREQPEIAQAVTPAPITPQPKVVEPMAQTKTPTPRTEAPKVEAPIIPIPRPNTTAPKQAHQQAQQHHTERVRVNEGSSKSTTDRYQLQKRGNKKQMDFFMIIAIISAILALAVLLYGTIVKNEIPLFDSQPEEQQEIIIESPSK